MKDVLCFVHTTQKQNKHVRRREKKGMWIWCYQTFRMNGSYTVSIHLTGIGKSM